jgi:DNA-binding MarR family transcriptional regulator
MNDHKAISDAPDRFPKEQMIDLIRGILLLQNKMKSDRFETWSGTFDGLTKMDLHILLLVQSRPDIVLGEIRERLDVPNSTLTGVIDRMERHGLVERTMSKRDRRSYGLKLTEKGRAVRVEHDRVLNVIAGRMLATLDEEERKTFIRQPSKVSDHMQP